MKCASCGASLPSPEPERCPGCGARPDAGGDDSASLDSILGRIDSPDATLPATAFKNLKIPPRRKPAAAVPLRHRRKSVVVMDDDDQTRRDLVERLGAAQVPVHDASDGRQGLSLIATLSPDVVVLDPDLGGDVPGPAVLERLRARAEFAAIPTLLYTRADEEPEPGEAAVRVAKSAGPDAVVEQVVRLFRAARA